MKRQREKAFVSNPLANATGRQYEKSGKTLTLDTSKLRQAGKLTTPQKPYKPEQCSMYILPRYKDFNFSQKGGKTITFNKYVEYCLKLTIPQNNLPVSTMAGISSTYMLGLSDDKISMDVVQAGLGFFKAYDRGYIQKIFDEINKHFENRSWYDEYLKNKGYYFSQTTSGFVYAIIEKNIFAIDLGITNSRVLDNVKIAILRFIFDQQGFFANGYNNVKKYNEDIAKKIRKKISEFGAEDIFTLGLSRVEKAASEAYFNEEYNRKITKPNEKTYNDAKEANSKKKSYLTILTTNANALTNDLTQEKKDQSENTTDPVTESGTIPSSNDDFPDKDNQKTNSDKTMLLVAVCVLIGLFFLKRKYK